MLHPPLEVEPLWGSITLILSFTFSWSFTTQKINFRSKSRIYSKLPVLATGDMAMGENDTSGKIHSLSEFDSKNVKEEELAF
mmetsp:Transcript_27052/g.39581  ORF Transcript_27052/g.39581 Transcript_27052/m.39581 type:complete len:82 (+) Transcript_27052:458-703(+)